MVGRWRIMKSLSSPPLTLSPAQRGQIVQRILVDGWTVADAAAAAGVPERLVAAWVSDYRRHGMASLRHRRGRTAPPNTSTGNCCGRFDWFSGAPHTASAGCLRPSRAVSPSPIRRSQDDRRGGS